MLLAVFPHAGVLGTTFEDESSLTILETLFVLAFVDSAISESFYSMAVLQVVVPVSDVTVIAGYRPHLTLAMSQALEEGSNVLVPLCSLVDSV